MRLVSSSTRAKSEFAAPTTFVPAGKLADELLQRFLAAVGQPLEHVLLLLPLCHRLGG